MSEVSEREWDNWRCLFTTPCEKWINLTDAELPSKYAVGFTDKPVKSDDGYFSIANYSMKISRYVKRF